jgi:hypothetical protein
MSNEGMNRKSTMVMRAFIGVGWLCFRGVGLIIEMVVMDQRAGFGRLIDCMIHVQVMCRYGYEVAGHCRPLMKHDQATVALRSPTPRLSSSTLLFSSFLAFRALHFSLIPRLISIFGLLAYSAIVVWP